MVCIQMLQLGRLCPQRMEAWLQEMLPRTHKLNVKPIEEPHCARCTSHNLHQLLMIQIRQMPAEDTPAWNTIKLTMVGFRNPWMLFKNMISIQFTIERYTIPPKSKTCFCS